MMTSGPMGPLESAIHLQSRNTALDRNSLRSALLGIDSWASCQKTTRDLNVMSRTLLFGKGDDSIYGQMDSISEVVVDLFKTGTVSDEQRWWILLALHQTMEYLTIDNWYHGQVTLKDALIRRINRELKELNDYKARGFVLTLKKGLMQFYKDCT